jgi:hypothetical protein
VWESRSPKSPSAERHLFGCAGDQVFGERTRDCSLLPALIKFRIAGAVRRTALRTSACSIAYDYIELTHEISRANGATDDLSIGLSAGYTLFLVFVHILLLSTAYVSSDIHMHIHIVTYVTVIFWIKLKLKITISLPISTLSE